MSDIGKYVINERARNRDPEGHMDDLEPWSDEIARNKALDMGIELTDEHWQVVHFLRDRFREQGQASSGRHLLEELEERFAHDGGRRHLYELFPRGPVTQASEIAGLPLPPYTKDASFGSAE